jgi:tetratricopeptide (TPR) repeat protein
MSNVAEAPDVVCANCGVAEVDDIKLEECDGCDLVKYWGDKCKEKHREQHEEECKKREATLHDKKLFRQPDGNHRGECPLCFLPMPLEMKKSTFYSCCSKTICYGCDYANYKSNGCDRCPFCREPIADDQDESNKRKMNRIKANDPAAMRNVGNRLYREGDHGKALKYWTKAAELGDIHAHCQLGAIYYNGEGVEKDEEKAVYHMEKAAIGGHPKARHNLACKEHNDGNMDRAVKHFIIAANLGFELSMKALWKHYSKGNITKEDLDATLRTHHAAIDEMKSPEREAAEKVWR